MRFGLLITNQHLPPEPSVERFAETIEQVRLAGDLRFDLVLFGQHFLVNEFQMLQPAVAAARLAAEAGPMRVGITIYLLSLLNPVAVAEEVATLDILTGGRWAGEPVTFASPYGGLVGPRPALRPRQRPPPPVWVAANNDRAVERAAEIGDTWIINPHATLETIGRQIGLYRAALARAGKPFPSELPMMREICVAESRAEAVQLARPYLEQKYRAYVQWGQHRALPRDDDMTQAFDDLLRDRFILGDPSECAAEIRRCIAATGATTMLFRVHWPGMPHETVTRAMRFLAEKVWPLVG